MAGTPHYKQACICTTRGRLTSAPIIWSTDQISSWTRTQFPVSTFSIFLAAHAVIIPDGHFTTTTHTHNIMIILLLSSPLEHTTRLWLACSLTVSPRLFISRYFQGLIETLRGHDRLQGSSLAHRLYSHFRGNTFPWRSITIGLCLEPQLRFTFPDSLNAPAPAQNCLLCV